MSQNLSQNQWTAASHALLKWLEMALLMGVKPEK